MVAGAKAVILLMQNNFSKIVGETEGSLLCQLLYTGTFAHCANENPSPSLAVSHKSAAIFIW
jgi:hypothetical protein